MSMIAYEKSKKGETDLTVTLTFDERNKSRSKALTNDGKEIAWILDRGVYLKDRDILSCEDGTLVRVQAAPEPVSKVSSKDPHAMTRAAYHLGNRHVPLQVNIDSLLYQTDHVLDRMIEGLGLKVDQVELAFQPEDGAYHGH